ncbi:hypothetical protein FB45DRAFT_1024877 [Roridomyces roridus]|uniref:DUF6534 domain-containing protein n=1 Tax=Roridomyces roridus TaxID=1738132 RepID=A0AAD7FT87_9AGAR|nr:hypothetical protein FB45DRAFT_1024877 [Roridomyces roridus]
MSTLQGIHLTLGPLLAGSMSAVGLSALVGFQTFLYFRIYPQDKMKYKLLVAWIWTADAAHTLFVCLTVWDYVIAHFGDKERVAVITLTAGILYYSFHAVSSSDLLTMLFQAHILMTLAATFSANLFYIWRIHKMSKGNWYLIVPILMLCAARSGTLLANFHAEYPMLNVTVFGLMLVFGEWKYKSWATVYEHFLVVRSLAFITSAITDIVISVARYYYLRGLNQGYFQTKEVVDTVLVFTLNDGLLTSAVAVVIMSCILAMHTNFVWVGIYFNFTKLFANSVLATLNLRNWYRHMHRPMGISLARDPHVRNTVQLEMNRGHVLTSPRTEAMPQDAEGGVMDPVGLILDFRCDADEATNRTIVG